MRNKIQNRFRKTFCAAILCAHLVAAPDCILYRIDIQQGNEITLQMLDELALGMTRREVTKTLGSPLVTDPFHADRWDYYFYRKRGETGAIEQHFATVFFDGDSLTKVESSLFPDE